MLNKLNKISLKAKTNHVKIIHVPEKDSSFRIRSFTSSLQEKRNAEASSTEQFSVLREFMASSLSPG